MYLLMEEYDPIKDEDFWATVNLFDESGSEITTALEFWRKTEEK
jgi:hypothetical protein